MAVAGAHSAARTRVHTIARTAIATVQISGEGSCSPTRGSFGSPTTIGGACFLCASACVMSFGLALSPGVLTQSPRAIDGSCEPRSSQTVRGCNAHVYEPICYLHFFDCISLIAFLRVVGSLFLFAQNRIAPKKSMDRFRLQEAAAKPASSSSSAQAPASRSSAQASIVTSCFL